MAPTELSTRDMLAESIMRDAWDLHDKAQKCSFIQRMVESRISRPQYRLLLADLHVVYSAIEDVAEKVKDDDIYGVMYCPDELNRVKALEDDLAYFYGSKWRKEVKPTKAALRYAEYIRHVGKTRPSLLLAHAFVRYLGDLFGGQSLKFKMTRSMALPETGEGTKFYQFDKVRNACRLKNYLMARVNNLEIDVDLYNQLIEESRLAFIKNIDIFEELEVPALRLAQLMHPSENILIFEKLWQASAVVLSFTVVYNLSKGFRLV